MQFGKSKLERYMALSFAWVIYFILSYHRCFIWQKSAYRVYYSYLRQAIHDIVTSQVNIPIKQIAAVFSYLITYHKSWFQNQYYANFFANNWIPFQYKSSFTTWRCIKLNVYITQAGQLVGICHYAEI